MKAVHFKGSRKWKASTFLFYTLIVFPTLIVALALAVDFTRLILANRQLATAMNTAASAGAWGVTNSGNIGQIDRAKATTYAGSAYCQSWVSAITAATPISGEKPANADDCYEAGVGGDTTGADLGLTVTFTTNGSGVTDSITASGQGRVSGLFFLNFLQAAYTQEDVTNSVVISAENTAEVCVADVARDRCPRPAY